MTEPHCDHATANKIKAHFARRFPFTTVHVVSTHNPLLVRGTLDSDIDVRFTVDTLGRASLSAHHRDGKHLGQLYRDRPSHIGSDDAEGLGDLLAVLLAQRSLIPTPTVELSWTTFVRYTALVSEHELRLAARDNDDSVYITADGGINLDEFTGSVTGEFPRLLARHEPKADSENGERTWDN